MNFKTNLAVFVSAGIILTGCSDINSEITPTAIAQEAPRPGEILKEKLLENIDQREEFENVILGYLNRFIDHHLIVTITISTLGTSSSAEEVNFAVHSERPFTYKAPFELTQEVGFDEAINEAIRMVKEEGSDIILSVSYIAFSYGPDTYEA